ncbi:MAG: D-aminoacyl-tRNA deacylase [Actinomycetota bacterium]|jgi:D-tyrosyl-tRNA(Tyr) deacylase|nr:D-tyrosyl-tRNA(Tyr) deacylase [Acidimicrobiaceae bacterium]MEC7899926.1 D-aminoacyl-tRNA deacylase [Actinomycetota bacterium]|tara:strand:- start:592 stop:1029 length:438 start_codon:yes stop_codon:yes gene_type:complete
MRALVQRVVKATVRVENQTVGAIAQGLCVFVGVTHEDSFEESDQLVKKIVSLRIMDDENGVMNKSVIDVDGEILIVSQFTLYGDTSKGRRPGWSAAAAPDHAEPLIERVVEGVKAAGVVVETGRFREHMQVELINDGPATLMIEI